MRAFPAVIPLVAALAAAQTPFEFAVVRELIQGDPYIGVMRIEISPDDPAPGARTLEIAARAGFDLRASSHSIFPDTAAMFAGQTTFTLDTDATKLVRLFRVICDESRSFSAGITHLSVDLVSPDDMSWLSMKCSLTLADSMASGLVALDEFWSRAEVTSLEISTGCLPLEFEPPVPLARHAAAAVERSEEPSAGSSRHAWKSLILPGWGQAASGEGLWWVNLAIEAGGVFLILSDHENEGYAVLGANHLAGFADLL
ncbi:hypothetical protein GX411_11130 [Candidatus Fermentibacteria bacterium]|nr:hypothetical protein [Candidatus Fermentibacteria bacterium]